MKIKDEGTGADLVTRAMKQYEAALLRYAVSILGDLERSREVVQDTFLKLCTSAPDSVRAHLAQWLFTVCRNGAFDVRRKESRMTPLTDNDLEKRPRPGPRPLEELERHEQLNQILECIRELPPKEREVVTLKFQCDLSYKEISEITSLSVNHVGVLIHNGVSRIRNQLNSGSAATPSLVRRLS